MIETAAPIGGKLEELKKLLGTAVFGLLLFSMTASFFVSLSQDTAPLHVVTCPDSYQEIITISESEYEYNLPGEYRLMILKHVISDFKRKIPVERGFEIINDPQFNLTKGLPQDIFYPPKSTRSDCPQCNA